MSEIFHAYSEKETSQNSIFLIEIYWITTLNIRWKIIWIPNWRTSAPTTHDHAPDRPRPQEYFPTLLQLHTRHLTTFLRHLYTRFSISNFERFSAVSKPVFGSKCSVRSNFQYLQDVHTFVPLQTQTFWWIAYMFCNIPDVVWSFAIWSAFSRLMLMILLSIFSEFYDFFTKLSRYNIFSFFAAIGRTILPKNSKRSGHLSATN